MYIFCACHLHRKIKSLVLLLAHRSTNCLCHLNLNLSCKHELFSINTCTVGTYLRLASELRVRRKDPVCGGCKIEYPAFKFLLNFRDFEVEAAASTERSIWKRRTFSRSLVIQYSYSMINENVMDYLKGATRVKYSSEWHA